MQNIDQHNREAAFERPAISPRQDANNLLKIHDYLQGRVLFRRFYPSEFSGSFDKNKGLLDLAIKATPEERDVMAATFMRRVRLQFLVVISLALIVSWLLWGFHR